MEASDRQRQNAAYCLDQVRKFSEDRYVAAQFAAKHQHQPLIVLYALATEIHRIPASVSEPTLGAIRQQWWRDALAEIRNNDNPRAHPVVESIAPLFEDTRSAAVISDTILSMIAATDELLSPGEFESLGVALECASQIYGGLSKAALQVLSVSVQQETADLLIELEALYVVSRTLAQPDKAVADAEVQVDTFQQRLGRFARSTPDIADQLRQKWREKASKIGPVEPEIMPAVVHLALTPGYLKRVAGKAGYNPLAKRLCLFKTVLTGRL
ncbi:MAG: squalene/phytoene synthase family protein [Aquisalinus sp.]|nr:squalene/phytoene synthase family protein [Aquisalinus sp.]